MYKILMVCTGNICRSPTAHGFLEQVLTQENLNHLVHIDSAGTTATHTNEPPDRRSQEISYDNGVDLSHIRSRKITIDDYETFDLILAMDKSHMHHMLIQAPAHTHHKIHLYLDFTNLPENSEVPDPYYGGPDGFQLVVDLVNAATNGLIYILKSQLVK